MTTKEIKSQIQKSLDKVPENVLHDILNILKEAEKNPAKSVALAKNLRNILSEDKELLERLAK